MVKNNRILLLFATISAGIVGLDQITKYLVRSLRPDLAAGVLRIHYVENTGAGFGLLKGQMLILAVISAIVAITTIMFYKKIPQDKIAQVLFALFLGGVLGNLIDRALRGYVIDFFDVTFWPVFNIADMAISISVIGLVLYYWKNEKNR